MHIFIENKLFIISSKPYVGDTHNLLWVIENYS